MIRVVTSRHLTGMEAEAHRLREEVAAAKADSEQALEREVAAVQRLTSERQRVEGKLSNALFNHEVDQLLVAKLRREVAELVEEVRQAEAAPAHVYVLHRRGELHSVHASVEGAKTAAAAAYDGPVSWRDAPADKPLVDSPWRLDGTRVLTEDAGAVSEP